MAGKITREQSYVTNQALQQSSLLSTTMFQGLIHSLSKDWNQPKESTTTAPPTVCTLVRREHKKKARVHTKEGIHTVQCPAVATVVLQPAKCTHKPQQLKLITLEMLSVL